MSATTSLIMYAGQQYRVDSHAEPTGRVFPGSFHDATRGDRWIEEVASYGHDANGDRVQVIWQYDTDGDIDDADLSVVDANIVRIKYC